MALTDNLMAYWELEESSGTRNDAHSTNHLTDNNTVLSGTGKVGTAADFEYDNSEYLSIVDNANLSVGNIDFSIAAWVKLESKPVVKGSIVLKEGSNDLEYSLRWNPSNDRFEFIVTSGAGFANSTGIAADTFGAPALATWYFVVAWHDATADTINIQINNGTADSTTYGLGSYNSAAPFGIGGMSAYPEYFDGLIDQVGFWKKVLTTGDKTSLYNSGNGLSYAALSSAGGTPITVTFSDSLAGGEVL